MPFESSNHPFIKITCKKDRDANKDYLSYQPIVRRGLKSLLQEEGFVIVGECSEGRLVSQLAEAQRPHLVILDFYLPDIPGIEICNRLVRKLPAIKTLLLTGCRHVPTLARLVRSLTKGLEMRYIMYLYANFHPGILITVNS